MILECPRCYRPTYWPRRIGNDRIKPKNLEVGTVKALTRDGTCTACWRIINNRVRPTNKGVINKAKMTTRHVITDTEVENIRAGLVNFWADRRRRGIHPEGQDPATLQRHGRTLIEV